MAADFVAIAWAGREESTKRVDRREVLTKSEEAFFDEVFKSFRSFTVESTFDFIK